jgi:two-component system chemotaxis response regulator CheY
VATTEGFRLARIVIVDDSLLIRRMLSDILMSAGHEVVGEAVDGLEAPVCVHEHRPDLVTLDLIMPGRGGMMTLKHLKMVDPSLAVVICSASLDERKVMQALRLGASGFIVKPFTRELVLDSIRDALSGDGGSALVETAAPPLERRRQARVEAALPVSVLAPGEGATLTTETVNVGVGGLLLAGGPLTLGAKVRVELELAPEEPTVEAVARVVRVTSGGRPALAFERVSLSDLERLTSYVDGT